jgi:nicotinamidase-related amidase
MKTKTFVLAFVTLVAAMTFLCSCSAIPGKNLKTPYTEMRWNKTALLVIDTQNDFGTLQGAHPMPNIETAIPDIVKIIKLFRRTGKPIIHVVRLYESNGKNVDYCRRWQVEQGKIKIIVPGTWGAELVASTNPTGAKLNCKKLLQGNIQTLTSKEFVIYKSRFNGFYKTKLNNFLRSKNINSVLIVGITFPNCVRATQIGAVDNNFRVALVPSACTAVYHAGLKAMQGEGVQLMTLEELKKTICAKELPTLQKKPLK